MTTDELVHCSPGYDWPVPTYESIDDFVAGLERLELLSDDPLVMTVLQWRCPDDVGSDPSSVAVSQVTGLTETASGQSSAPGPPRRCSSAASRSST